MNGVLQLKVASGDVAAARLDIGTTEKSAALFTMSGGTLCATEFVRLGEVAGSHGRFELTGGVLCTTEFAIGGMNQREKIEPPCEAELEISGGSLITKYLALGWMSGSTARLRIIGSQARGIAVLNSMDCAIANGAKGSRNELEFVLDSGGVTPIDLRSRQATLTLARKNANSTCALRIRLNDVPPGGDVTLVHLQKPCAGTFIDLPEGSAVRAEHAGQSYEWRMTYRGGASHCDLALTSPQIVTSQASAPFASPNVSRARVLEPSAIAESWNRLFAHIDSVAPPLRDGPLAFPGAEGFGAHARGGRGGRVIFVTTLADSGPGTLREAIDAKGPRTVIFRVGGTIELKTALQIREPFITIAGQTAPGDGICLHGAADTLTLVNTHDVIVRHLRVRTGFSGTGDAHEGDCISCYASQDFILDHCSASWGTDETISCTETCDRYTVQWCFMSEALNFYGHSMGSILGGDRSTWHHNLYAHCRTRNPRFAGLCRADFRNNVIYDWGDAAGYGDFRAVNYVGNYLVPGPSTKQKPPRFILGDSYVLPGALHAAGNVIAGFDAVTADNSSGTGFDREVFAAAPHRCPTIHNQPASEAFESVLSQAGVTWPRRDVVDTRIVREVRERTGEIIKYEREVGGVPPYVSGPVPLDSDADGIPDDWERMHGLDPQLATDANTVTANGYTNLEVYLNGLAPDLYATSKP